MTAIGLLMMSFANTGARNEAVWAEPLFWLGLAVQFVPIALRLAYSKLARRERVGLIVLLSVTLYFVKILHSPLFFSYYDELLTWRTTYDIIAGRHLFQSNSLLPVGPLYPGIGNVTAALATLSGLSIFSAGTMVIGVARAIFALALYLFYEEVGKSARVAGIAALLYMTNPNYLFFDAQFAYESLALPLALLTLFAIVRRSREPTNTSIGLNLVVLLGLSSVIVTHHVTSYTLVVFLIILALVNFAMPILGNRNGKKHSLTNTALLALVGCSAWLTYVASLTVGYLTPPLAGGITELLQIINGELAARKLFASLALQGPPLWERLAASISIFLVGLGLIFGLLHIFRWQRDRATVLSLAIGSLAYPLTHILRFTESGFFVPIRAAEFLFVGSAFTMAVGMIEHTMPRLQGLKSHGIIAAWATAIFIGGITLGRPSWMRLPGPYLVIADTRSIEPQGIAAAEWARAFLGPDNRIASDRINSVLMGSYGGQRAVTGIQDQADLGTLFLSSEMGEREQAIIREADIRYLVSDLRLNGGLPIAGFYYQITEPDANHHMKPPDLAVLAKLDYVEAINRIFDSGDIVIYDVEILGDG